MLTLDSQDVVNSYLVLNLTGDASGFAHLTFAKLAQKLQPLASPYFAVGVMFEGKHAGLAIGFLQGSDALLLSVMVGKSFRGHGLGHRLLASWENSAAGLGAKTVWARFTHTMSGCDAFLAIINRAGWDAPTDLFYQVTGRAGEMATAGGAWAGVSGRIRQRTHISYAPFELGTLDDRAIDRLLAQPEAVTMRDPRHFLNYHVAEASTSIRRGDKLIGWIIAIPATANLGPETVEHGVVSLQYAENYLDADLWHTGASIGGYHHCFTAQAATFGDTSLAIYRTHPGMARMAAFTMKRFAPLALRTDVVRSARKNLIAVPV